MVAVVVAISLSGRLMVRKQQQSKRRLEELLLIPPASQPAKQCLSPLALVGI